MSSAHAQTGLDTARYTLHVSPSLSTLSVDADISADRHLVVRQGAADQLPLGWVTFVRDLRVTAESQQLQPQADSARGWTLPGSGTRRVHLHYVVDLSYARTAWPPGNEQAGFWDSTALYTVTKPIFVTGDRPTPAVIEFDIPAGWQIATPWPAYTGRARTYLTGDSEDLVNNSFVVGRFSDIRLQRGPFDFSIALLGTMRRDSALVRRMIPPVAAEYARIFPDMPRTTYLMTLFYGTEDDGEAFLRSSAFRTRDRITQQNTILWANTLAHELFHYWNGGLIDGSDEVDKQWFMEGATEYYANRTLLRAGAISTDAFLDKVGAMAGLYTYFRTQPMFDTVSVLKSGQRKTRYRFGVYNGGWSIVFALDQRLREASNGCRSFDDVFRTLFREFGLTGKRYVEADIEAAVARVSGHDESAFFKRYVAGLTLLPMDSVLKRAGVDASFIDYAGEAYVRLTPAPTAAQSRAWKGLRSGDGACRP